MKTAKILLTAFFLTLFSCSEDDDILLNKSVDKDAYALLVGHWELGNNNECHFSNKGKFSYYYKEDGKTKEEVGKIISASMIWGEHNEAKGVNARVQPDWNDTGIDSYNYLFYINLDYPDDLFATIKAVTLIYHRIKEQSTE